MELDRLDGHAGVPCRRLTRLQAAQMQLSAGASAAVGIAAAVAAAAAPAGQPQQHRQHRSRRAQDAKAATCTADSPVSAESAPCAAAAAAGRPGHRKRPRSNSASDSAGTADAEDYDQPAAKQQAATAGKHVPTRALVEAVMANPDAPESLQIAVNLLQSVVLAPLLSQPYWKAAGAVLRLAKQVPLVLLQAVLVDGRPLQHVLQTIHSGSALVAHTAALCIANLAKAATDNSADGSTSLAVGLLQALMADQQQGLMLLLRGMYICNDNVALASASAVAFLARAPAVPLPASSTVPAALLLQGLLQQQQQGLHLLLMALDGAKTADAAAFTLRGLAQAEPVQLLDALLQPLQRRGLQYMLRALCCGSERAANKTYDALLHMAQAANQQQLAALLHHLLRSMRQGSLGAARVVWAVSQTPTGQVVLLQYVQQLLQMLQQPGQPCQAAAAAALWHVAESHNGSLALAQQDLSPLLGAMLVGGEVAVMSACIVCFLTLTEAALHQLVPHVADLLLATQPQHPAPVVSMAIRSIFCISTTGGPAGLAQVLANMQGVLQVMQQPSHPDAAAVAGNTVLNLLQSEEGKACISQEQHIDALLQVLLHRGPAMVHAARALAHVASTSPAGKAALLQPQRLEVLHGMHTLLPALETGTHDTAAYESFAPLFWVSVAAGALEVVPAYIGKLVRSMRLMHLTMPCFDALTHMTSFKGGLLALAPYLQHIQAALSACVAANHLMINHSALQQYLQWMVSRVHAVISELRVQQQVAQACMHQVSVRLAQLQTYTTSDNGGGSRVRTRRQRLQQTHSRQQQVLTLLLLRRLQQAHEHNEKLLQQLQAAQGPACLDDQV